VAVLSKIRRMIMREKYYDDFNAIITITEEYNSIIHFSGAYNTRSNDIKFVVRYSGLLIESQSSECQQADSYFPNSNDSSSSIFDFNISYTDTGYIEFFVRLDDGNLLPANVSYAFPSRINDLQHSFFIGDKTLITRIENSNSLYAQPLEYEKLCAAVNLYTNTNFNEQYHEDKEVIQQYLAQYPIMSKKRIWLLTDRPNRADDNGEYLFKYSARLNDGVEKYFVVDEKSPDAVRLASFGKIVNHASAQHKLLYLFAEKFISSHLHGRLRDICDSNKYALYAGLDKCQTLFIQHGIILHDMAFWLKRDFQNLKFFVTTSEHEYNSILEDNYGYDKNVVMLTGMPRYDSLYNNNKRKILFAPTWRGGMSSSDLSASLYCKKINDLLCDKKFIGEAKKNGYDVLFKPHPNYAHMVSCFKADSYVQIIPYDASYQELFAECSLLITDFSSTAFDFSYLKKPVIYYWFTDYMLKQSYFDYKTMGFGKVTTKHDELVETAVSYMKNNCVMEDEYKLRVDSFFVYFDKKNTERVYNEIVKI